MHIFSYIFLLILVVNLVLKLYLNQRQIKAILLGQGQVPEYFKATISLAEHQSAAAYNLQKINLNKEELILSTLLILAFSFGGGLNLISYYLANLANYPLSQEVLIIFSYVIINAIIHLPISYYSHFKLEARFGFNKMTIKTFIIDNLKSLLLLIIIGAPILYLIFYFLISFPNNWWLLAWVVLVIFNLLMLVIYPTIIAPLFNKFTPLNQQSLKDKILNLLTDCGFKSNGIFVMDGSKRSSHGNAYFTGIGSCKRIVFFDTLLNNLKEEEIIAVLAHELGHFKYKHIIKQIILSFLLTLCGLYITSLLIKAPWFYSSLNIAWVSNANGLILASMLLGLITVPLTPITSYFARKNEFEADHFAKEKANYLDLISGLVKLYRDNASTLTPDALYVKFYYSHPPAILRIKALKQK